MREEFSSCTFLEEQEKLSSVQLKAEAVLALSFHVKKYPRVPQGFELQRDAVRGRRHQPRTQTVEKAAAAIKTDHIRF